MHVDFGIWFVERDGNYLAALRRSACNFIRHDENSLVTSQQDNLSIAVRHGIERHVDDVGCNTRFGIELERFIVQPGGSSSVRNEKGLSGEILDS